MLNKDKIAFDIGALNTRVVVGKGTKNQIMIKDAFTFKTPANSVEDGHILDVNLLRDEILNRLEERKIKANAAVFSLSSTKMIMRELTLPYAPTHKIEAMVPFELAKHLPITVEDFIIKFIPLEVIKEKNQKNFRIMAVALPKYLVKRYWELCTEMEIKPLALTIHVAGATSLLQKKNDDSGETVALLDLGYSSINCSIIHGGRLVFNRMISIGKKEIKEDSSESLLNDSKMQLIVDKWLEEIKLVSRFYVSLKSGNQVDKIILLGGGSRIKNIAQYTEEKLEKPVLILSENSRIKYKGFTTFPLNLYFNAATALLLN